LLLLFFVCLQFGSSAQDLVDKINVSDQEANIQFISPNEYMLEIAGPDNYYYKYNVQHTDEISLSNVKANGEKFGDGSYRLQITPILTLSNEDRNKLSSFRANGNEEAIAEYRAKHNLPSEIDIININFGIRDGKFVKQNQKEFEKINMPTLSSTWQQDHPSLYASLNMKDVMAFEGVGHPLEMDQTRMSEDMQVFTTDVIVQGSICVGFDCVSSESFGFDTQRLKENNLRIHFDDTSNSASFPGNDWRIAINDSSNGGLNYFAVEDATAGTTPLRILAGAGNNAIYVSSSGGNVGMGTASPVVELHVTDGDTPTLRFEQNGSNGWTPQTWDMAGNETNFFVRDVTNGSKLPFKIKPGAPDNALFVAADGKIGLSTANPSDALHVKSGNIRLEAGNLKMENGFVEGNLGVNVAPGSFALNIKGNSQFDGTSLFNGDATYVMTTGVTYFNSSFGSVMRLDAANSRVGIGTASPGTELEVCGTISATSTTISNAMNCSSDSRFKKNVTPLKSSLDKVLKLSGVNYDWKVNEFPKKNFDTDLQMGFIAQEVAPIFPELVQEDAQGYLAVDYSKLTPALVEAIKEQQKIIDQQQNEIDELKALNAKVENLAELVSKLNRSSDQEQVEILGEEKK